VEVLVDRVAGEPMRFCNNAAVAGDGTVYFSDSSRRFGIDQWRADLLEHSGTGRLLRREPSGAVEVLLDGLQFANGVALAAEGRSWRSPRPAPTGSPGCGFRASGRGGPTCWRTTCPGSPITSRPAPAGCSGWRLAVPATRCWTACTGCTRRCGGRCGRCRSGVQRKPVRTLWVVAVDAGGAVVHDLQGPGDDYTMVTGVREHGGRLYLGSLAERAVAVLDLPPA
jgi:hypothetical protein